MANSGATSTMANTSTDDSSFAPAAPSQVHAASPQVETAPTAGTSQSDVRRSTDRRRRRYSSSSESDDSESESSSSSSSSGSSDETTTPRKRAKAEPDVCATPSPVGDGCVTPAREGNVRNAREVSRNDSGAKRHTPDETTQNSIFDAKFLESIKINKIDRPSDCYEDRILEAILKLFKNTKEEQFMETVVKRYTFSYSFVISAYVLKRYYVTSNNLLQILTDKIAKFLDYRLTSEYNELVRKIYTSIDLFSAEEVTCLARLFLLSFPNDRRNEVREEIDGLIEKSKIVTNESKIVTNESKIVTNEENIFINIMHLGMKIKNAYISSKNFEIKDIDMLRLKISQMCDSSYSLSNEMIVDILNLLFVSSTLMKDFHEIKRRNKTQDEISDKEFQGYIADFVKEANKIITIIFNNLNNTYPSVQRDLSESLKLSFGLKSNVLYYKYLYKLKENFLILNQRNSLKITASGIDVVFNVGNIFYYVFRDIIEHIEKEFGRIFSENHSDISRSYDNIKENLTKATIMMLSLVVEMIDSNVPNKFIFVLLSYFVVSFGVIPAWAVPSCSGHFAKATVLDDVDSFARYVSKVRENKEKIENTLESQLNEISVYDYHQIINNGDNYIFGMCLIYKNLKFSEEYDTENRPVALPSESDEHGASEVLEDCPKTPMPAVVDTPIQEDPYSDTPKTPGSTVE